MLDAAKAAEAVITTGQVPDGIARPDSPAVGQEGPAGAEVDRAEEGDEVEGNDEVGVASPAISSSTAPTVIDVNTLTPQTFLIRPTRPDANRNRGRNAFKRKPKPKPAPGATGPPPASDYASGEQIGSRIDGFATPLSTPAVEAPPPPLPTSTPAQTVSSDLASKHQQAMAEPEDEEEAFDESLVEEMEHLQLSLEEAWFLSMGLGVLRIYNGDSVSRRGFQCRDGIIDDQDHPLPNPNILSLFLSPPSAPSPLAMTPKDQLTLHPDDPFLVSYVAYHHFRSLGWVVKPGIKFACDWLLYRRGPVFSHAA
jgi:tRNA-splicing endonuclease subunit Sen2